MKLYFLILIFMLLMSSFVLGVDHKFEVNIPIIQSVVKSGEIVNNSLNIFNGKTEQDFKIKVFSEDKFISVNNDKFSLGDGGDYTLNVILNARNLKEGVYVGKVVIVGQDKSLILPVILEIESPEVKVDISSEISPKFSEVVSGGELKTEVNVYNLKSSTGNVLLNYFISNLDGSVILSESQNLVVGNQIQITKTFDIPENLSEGDYLFYIIASNEGSIGTSASLFSVSKKISLSPVQKTNKNYFFFIFSSIIIVLIVSFLFLNYYWNQRVVNTAKNWNKKLVDIKKIKFGETAKEIRNLEYKNKLLKKAYDKKYIKKDSYLESKRRIDEVIKKLKKRL